MADKCGLKSFAQGKYMKAKEYGKYPNAGSLLGPQHDVDHETRKWKGLLFKDVILWTAGMKWRRWGGRLQGFAASVRALGSEGERDS